MSTKLNSNPEILLKKRKNADRLRLEKQEAARLKQEEKKKQAAKKKDRFLRAETILARKIESKKELKRVGRVTKVAKSKNERIKLVEDTEAEVEAWNQEPKLLLVARIKTEKRIKIPNKAQKTLEALRLGSPDLGTFIKLTPTVLPLLKLIAPYIVIGSPSLITVRELIQKRGNVLVDGKQVMLDDNSVIEDKLGNLGLICTEDLVHELYTLGDEFKKVMNFLRPFELAAPVTGWGPMAKLKRYELQEERENNKVNSRASAPLVEIDIDQYIANQN